MPKKVLDSEASSSQAKVQSYNNSRKTMGRARGRSAVDLNVSMVVVAEVSPLVPMSDADMLQKFLLR